ncbi:MAG: hypothetical protein LBV04_10640 [Deferribacteraceae bacterium]|jgi:hypothetical protein|nr:hypothetical protein [Deferribacteraceae bacterium]
MGALNIKQEKSKSQLTKLYEMLREIFESEFYGSLEVKFEAGKVTIIRKTESIKL